MAAIGWQRSKVRRLLLIEGAILSAMGATVGLAGGVIYAYGMVVLTSNVVDWCHYSIIFGVSCFDHKFSHRMDSEYFGCHVRHLLCYSETPKVEIASLLKGRVEAALRYGKRRHTSSTAHWFV